MHEKIIQKWLGGRYAENATIGYQCVGWVKKYLEEIGSPVGAFGGSAIAGWVNARKTFDTEKFAQIPYSGRTIPPAGAVIFWNKTAKNPYGHVAIVEAATAEKVTIIEQNGGRGSASGLGVDAIRRVTIGYNDRGNCLGWYVLKNNNNKKMEIGSKNNYIEILKRELTKNPEYKKKFEEISGENLLKEKEIKALIEIIASRLEKEIKDYIDEKFVEFLKKICK